MRIQQTLLLILIGLFLASCSSPSKSPGLTPTVPSISKSTPTSTVAVNSKVVELPPLRTQTPLATLPAEGVAEFHIIHWNDFHAELVEHFDDGLWIPGAARFAAFVKSEKAKYDQGQVILLDAGDWLQGSRIPDRTLGKKTLQFFQMLGVNAMTVGSHEFHYGLAKYLEIVSMAAPIEMLSVNLVTSAGRSGMEADPKNCYDTHILNPYQVYDLGAVDGPKARVVVFGSTSAYHQYEERTPISGICFIDPADQIIKLYDQIMDLVHPDVLVVISHGGFDYDQILADTLNKAGKPVNIIIGGHTHTWIEAPAIVGNTYVVQADGLGRDVGVFDLTFDRATKVLTVNWRQEMFNGCSPQDQETLSFVQDMVPTPTPGPTPTARPSSATYLMDLPPITEEVGAWTLGKGIYPETDNGIEYCVEIDSHGRSYPYGLFAHAPSKLEYALDGNYTHFITDISIKETANCGDGAIFIVRLDGKEVFRSDLLTRLKKPVSIDLDVTGVKLLSLETDGGVDNGCDWTIWGDPYLLKTP